VLILTIAAAVALAIVGAGAASADVVWGVGSAVSPVSAQVTE
jgi:hypothetical protein